MENNKTPKALIIVAIILKIIVSILMLSIVIGIITGDDPEFSEDESQEIAEDYSSDDEEEEEADGEEPDSEEINPISVGTNAKNATIMVYMNGSDLETQAGEATTDISEMLDSGIGHNVNVVIQTMGTKKWHDYGISSKTAQRYCVKDGELKLLEDGLGQLDCTESDTLSDFISYGKKRFPADRYMFIFWDHGGGPVYGFGYDEWQDEESSLSLDEMRTAFEKNSDVEFDIIGMDCCIMANMETCYALSPYCKYAVLSEDFESGLGWYYTKWMKEFEKNPGMSTPLLGKKIVDEMVSSNEKDDENGGSTTMVLVNEHAVPGLLDAWMDYAYKNTDELLGLNYSKLHKARGRSFIANMIEMWADDLSNVTMADYYVSDMLAIVENVGSESDETDALRSSLKASVAYFGHTSDKNELTGLAVSLPYGDQEYYDELSRVYSKCGIDEKYIEWLSAFVEADGRNRYNDFSDFENSWGGWATCTSCGTGSQGYSDEGYSNGGCSTEGYSNEGCSTGGYSDEGCSNEEYYSEEYSDDWTYDYETGLWYLYKDDILYGYDDETDTTYYYDDENDEMYYYDETDDEWNFAE